MANFNSYQPLNLGSLVLQGYAAPRMTREAMLSAQLQNASRNLSNQKMQAESPYWGPMSAAQASAMDLANQRSGALLPFAAPTAQADLDQTRASIQDILQGKIPLERAQAGMVNVQAKYLPEKLQQQENRFGPEFQFLKFVQSMPAETRNAFLADHMDEYNQALSSVASRMKQYQQGTPSELPVSDKQKNNLKNLFGDQKDLTVDPEALKNPFRNTAQQTQTASNIAKMVVNKSLTDAPLRNRYQAAVAASELLKDPAIEDSFKTLAKFSGLEGSIKANRLRLPKSLGGDPIEYSKIQSARDQLGGVLSGSIKTLEGMPTSNKGLQQALSFFRQSQATLGSDYGAAMSFFNRGKQLLNAEAKSLQKAAEPAYEINRIPEETPFSTKENNSVSATNFGANIAPIRMIRPDGKEVMVHPEDIQEALSKKYRRK